jgi:serine/threonine-protein kinase
MNIELVKRALQIVGDVIELERDDRDAFIRRACADNPDLRHEVESLLNHERGTDIQQAAADDTVPEIPSHPFESRYQLGDEIGRGGMGAILWARDIVLGREVAVKVLLDSHKTNPDAVRRFINEAQIGARLQHPGIAPIHDLGRFEDQRPFLAMKLVRGKTLASIPSSQTDEDRAEHRSELLAIFERLCDTVAYAHSQGVIHRDLKPENIMIGQFGEVQVMDWGLAKVLSNGDVVGRPGPSDRAAELSRSSPRSGSDTRVGVFMGTPDYMPPEQTIGRSGKTTDVFSLGAILCEILTGNHINSKNDSSPMWGQ